MYVEKRFALRVVNLVVRDRRAQLDVAVDDADAAVNEPLAEHVSEGLVHDPVELRVHRVTLARPVAVLAHRANLVADRRARRCHVRSRLVIRSLQKLAPRSLKTSLVEHLFKGWRSIAGI